MLGGPGVYGLVGCKPFGRTCTGLAAPEWDAAGKFELCRLTLKEGYVDTSSGQTDRCCSNT